MAKRIYNRYETRVYRTLVWYLNIICRRCDETKQKKKKFFSSKEEAISHHFFLFFFSRMNVLKFAKINVGGWKQDTHDAYIKDLNPIKEAMIYVTATTVVVVC